MGISTHCLLTYVRLVHACVCVAQRKSENMLRKERISGTVERTSGVKVPLCLFPKLATGPNLVNVIVNEQIRMTSFRLIQTN